jgi:hypothetical protein
MKAIRDVHSFFQEDSLKIKNNHPILPYTAIIAYLYADMKISASTVRGVTGYRLDRPGSIPGSGRFFSSPQRPD